MHLYRGSEWVATVTHDWRPGYRGECWRGEHTTVTGPERRRVRRHLISWVPPGPKVPGSPWREHELPTCVMGDHTPMHWGHVENRLAMGSLPGVYDRFEIVVLRGHAPVWSGHDALCSPADDDRFAWMYGPDWEILIGDCEAPAGWTPTANRNSGWHRRRARRQQRRRGGSPGT